MGEKKVEYESLIHHLAYKMAKHTITLLPQKGPRNPEKKYFFRCTNFFENRTTLEINFFIYLSHVVNKLEIVGF